MSCGGSPAAKAALGLARSLTWTSHEVCCTLRRARPAAPQHSASGSGAEALLAAACAFERVNHRTDNVRATVHDGAEREQRTRQ